jgi:uncharacterized protein (TIGR02271 family)
MDSSQAPFSPVPDSSSTEEIARLSVIEERLQVGTKTVETGRVRISKVVHETTESIDLPLLREEYDVERVPVNAYVAEPPESMHYEGDTLVIPILQEVVVTETRLLLVEEIRLTKRQIESRFTQEIPLRREEVHFERQEPTPDSDRITNHP